MSVEGFGLGVTFHSGFCAKIVSLDTEPMKRKELDDTNNATPVNSGHAWMVFIASKLIDAGGIKVTLRFDPNTAPPIDQVAEPITITFPIPLGGNTAATWACSGFMTEFGVKGPHDNLMEADATLKFSGRPTFTAGT